MSSYLWEEVKWWSQFSKTILLVWLSSWGQWEFIQSGEFPLNRRSVQDVQQGHITSQAPGKPSGCREGSQQPSAAFSAPPVLFKHRRSFSGFDSLNYMYEHGDNDKITSITDTLRAKVNFFFFQSPQTFLKAQNFTVERTLRGITQ